MSHGGGSGPLPRGGGFPGGGVLCAAVAADRRHDVVADHGHGGSLPPGSRLGLRLRWCVLRCRHGRGGIECVAEHVHCRTAEAPRGFGRRLEEVAVGFLLGV